MEPIRRLRCRIADIRGRSVYAGWPNKNQVIFIHLPKTAGTSVSKALGIPSRHLRAKEYIIASPRKFKRFFKFAFVRNPYDRLFSSYTFLNNGGMNDDDARFAKLYVQPYESFEHFVLEGLACHSEIQSWVHFRPQSYFICDSQGKNLMDFTGRFEQVTEDYAVIAKRLGKPGSLPVTNQSRRGDYRDAYTSELIDVVSRLYAEDLKTFGYGFD